MGERDKFLESFLNEYVKRKDALDSIQIGKPDVISHPEIFTTAMDGMAYAAICVSEAQKADVEPVRHAEWIEPIDDETGRPFEEETCTSWECSACHEWMGSWRKFADDPRSEFLSMPNYCPFCGAKMEV